jgi:hypothetical protein
MTSAAANQLYANQLCLQKVTVATTALDCAAPGAVHGIAL